VQRPWSARSNLQPRRHRQVSRHRRWCKTDQSFRVGRAAERCTKQRHPLRRTKTTEGTPPTQSAASTSAPAPAAAETPPAFVDRSREWLGALASASGAARIFSYRAKMAWADGRAAHHARRHTLERPALTRNQTLIMVAISWRFPSSLLAGVYRVRQQKSAAGRLLSHIGSAKNAIAVGLRKRDRQRDPPALGAAAE